MADIEWKDTDKALVLEAKGDHQLKLAESILHSYLTLLLKQPLEKAPQKLSLLVFANLAMSLLA